ncbi:transcription factor PCF1-like [Cornus florida]|uniref:transcription factor PCF1-like n=1 Tax=Cornus florida TaxID=4283 RepID=UPI00289A868B|nr:transcription factor PCF1-like [Cornus florida]
MSSSRAIGVAEMVSCNSSTKQPKPIAATKRKASKANGHPHKQSKDRHVKVHGRDRRICLALECAKRVFRLSQVLGHRTCGQTIEWLLQQAEPAINAVISTNSSTLPSPPLPVIDGSSPLSSSPPSVDLCANSLIMSSTDFETKTISPPPENQASISEPVLPCFDNDFDTNFEMDFFGSKIASMPFAHFWQSLSG